MKVFISWSGERSGKVAVQLREWLSYLFESAEPWVSRSDIEAGARWGSEVQEELAATSFGILCLTRENVAAPWLLFEAGALAKALNDTFVIPYLLDLSPSDIPNGPLSQFQAKSADRQGTWELVKGINSALKEKGREQNKLSHIFDRWWPDLEKALARVFSESTPARTPRPVPDMIEEILVTVRNIERQLPLVTHAEDLDENWERWVNAMRPRVHLRQPSPEELRRLKKIIDMGKARDETIFESKAGTDSSDEEIK